jgi:S-adenosylmethionine-diacylglycerol 3-amino-3-carboxypropyl transferase
MNTAQQVLDAVRIDRVVSKQGVLQRLFAFWFDAFVYNQIWEDPRVDLEALQLDEDSRVLTISSGGCNALNYLVARPAAVTAVDLNRYHIHLLRLKIAALRYLPCHEPFFRFFGFGRHPDNVANYYRYLVPHLDADTRKFWEGNGLAARVLQGKRINYFHRGGLYEHSRNGYFLRFFHRFAHLSGWRPEELLTATSPAEQAELYRKHIAPFFDSLLIRTVGKLPVTMFGLGIPPQQLEELKHDLRGQRSIIDTYRERTQRLACSFPLEDNYFAWHALARKSDTQVRRAIPNYLRRENYEELRANAYRIRTVVGSVTDEIKRNPRETFNRFVFLDAQDWMDERAMTELWQAIADRAEQGSRIIFRTAGETSPLPNNLSPRLLSRFRYEREQSAEWFARDRAAIYGGFHLYVFE